MQIQNIANSGKKIFLFCRENDGSQKIIEDNSFYPFYYEPDQKGNCLAYDGTKLRKVIVAAPGDIAKTRSFNSYSSDIKFTKNYIIHRIKTILPSPIKYLFIDIEVLANEIPNYTNAKYPISCITVYNSSDKTFHTWYLGDYYNEEKMLDGFVTYVKKETPDLILAWNIDFDYNYLHSRIKDFAKKISPIGLSRMGEFIDKSIYYPAGISIVDYQGLFKKVYMREASYTLDYIGEKYTGKGKTYKEVDFSKLNNIIKVRNIGDVEMLVDIEKQKNLIPYYDEIRRMTKVQWEDLLYNSRIVEMLLFEEARLENVVLPNKPKIEKTSKFKGAIRDAAKPGLSFEVGKFDLGSAYPSMIVNFCLDPKNIIENEEICDCGSGQFSSGFNCIKCGKQRTEDAKAYVNGKYVGQAKVNGTIFRQDTNALLPSAVKKILVLKDNLKKEKKANPTEENSIKYDAIKAIVNSCFGAMGEEHFRFYKKEIAAATAFLVKDLLQYTQDKLKKDNLELLYYDTDGLFISGKDDKSKYLNQTVQDWGKEKYGKDKIELNFDYEGYFDSLFILATCHYLGYKNGKKEPEIRGIEVKRSSSSKFEAGFQRILIDKVINKENREIILNWKKEEVDRIKNLSPLEFSFPCKIQDKEYKTEVVREGKSFSKKPPIFVQAYENTQKIDKKFKPNKGELFYYVYMIGEPSVLGFNKHNIDIIDKTKIDWDRMIERNIENKIVGVFNAMGWELVKGIKHKAKNSGEYNIINKKHQVALF